MITSYHEQLLAAALAYARLGWSVLILYGIDDQGRCRCGNPDCRSPAKHPRSPTGLNSATTDEAKLSSELTPAFGAAITCNLGIVTGEKSGFWVLDVDGEEGKKALAALEKQHGKLPKTVTAHTGGGGLHLLFSYPKDRVITCSHGSLQPKLDVRGNGGYIVVAPSMHASGRQYQWAPKRAPGECVLAAAPVWLLDLISSNKKTDETPTVIRTCEPKIVEQAQRYLKAWEGADEDHKGGRKTLEAACCMTWGFGLTTEAALPLMLKYNERCTPPWTTKELQHKLSSSIKKNDHHKPFGHLLNPKDRRELTREATGQWMTPGDRARRLGNLGPRIQTGFATLDANTRGGFLSRYWIAVGGAPGAGKTTWLVQLALRWVKEGKHVAIVASDEDPSGIVIRIGQLLGYDRKQLEEGVPHVCLALGDKLDAMPNLHIVDGEDDDVTIESVSQALVDSRGAAQSIMIIDSIQTCRSDKAINLPDTSDTTRTRINLVVKAIKRAAKVDGHLILAASELNRGAYRSKKEEDRIDDLAAFKESGNIEYGAGICLVLRNVANAKGVIHITVPKNRLGPEKDAWRMTLNFTTASFIESVKPVEDTEEQIDEQCRQKVLVVLQAASSPLTKGEVANIINVRRATVLKVIDQLVGMHMVMKIKKGFWTTEHALKTSPKNSSEASAGTMGTVPAKGGVPPTVPAFPYVGTGTRNGNAARERKQVGNDLGTITTMAGGPLGGSVKSARKDKKAKAKTRRAR